MTTEVLLIVLPIITFSAVIVWALASKWQVQERMEDDDAPKSSLAKDG